MQLTPIISIDDAFVGICMKKAGLGHRLFDHKGFMYHGLQENANICTVVKSIGIHYPKFDYECMVSKIFYYAEKCEIADTLEVSASCSWYNNVILAPPNLDGSLYQRCGPHFNNSRCSTDRADWTVREPENGPCCSQNGYCVPTKWDCTCPDCVDFLEIENCKFFYTSLIWNLNLIFHFYSRKLIFFKDKSQAIKHNKGESCCSMVQIHTKMFFRIRVRNLTVKSSLCDWSYEAFLKSTTLLRGIFSKNIIHGKL